MFGQEDILSKNQIKNLKLLSEQLANYPSCSFNQLQFPKNWSCVLFTRLRCVILLCYDNNSIFWDAL